MGLACALRLHPQLLAHDAGVVRSGRRCDVGLRLYSVANATVASQGIGMKRIDSAGHQVLCPLYATAAPASPTPRRGIRVRPMKARKFVVLPSADAGGRKYSLIRRARWNQRVKGPSAPGAPDSGCRCHIISAARK